MQSIKAGLLHFLILALLSGCASVYRGGNPNFALTDKESVRKEIDRFTMNDSFWSAGYFFQMAGDSYSVESVKPLMAAVSSRGLTKLEAAQTIRTVQYTTFGIQLLSAIAWIVAPRTSDLHDPAKITFIASTVATLGTGFWGAYKVASASADFNEDLRARFKTHGGRFAPTVSFAFPY